MRNRPREALARLRDAERAGELEALWSRYGVRALVVFGSAAHGGPAPRDLDLAVDHDGDLDTLRLVEELAHVMQYSDFDLVDLRRAGVVARHEALHRPDVVFERHDASVAELAAGAMARFWDTQWLRDLQLEALAR